MTLETKLLDKILQGTKNNLIIWHKDPTKTIYRTYIMSEELKDLGWAEFMYNGNLLTLNIYPHEIKIPEYDKTKTFIKPNSIQKFENYVQTNTPLFVFKLDTDNFYGWIELMGLYHVIDNQKYFVKQLNVFDNLNSKDYYLKLRASVE